MILPYTKTTNVSTTSLPEYQITMTECVSNPQTWIDVAIIAIVMVPVSIFLWRFLR